MHNRRNRRVNGIRNRKQHLTPSEEQEIIAFAQSRVTVNQFCERMKIHPSTYASVLYRHGIRHGKVWKDQLVREHLAEQASQPPP